MNRSNFWKDRYQHKWSKSAEREEKIRIKIANETKRKVIPIGLGAESREYLPGSAASQGFEKGGADFAIADTNIHLEITGPLVDSVGVEKDLWIRPDKILSARNHTSEFETWIIHHLPKNDLIRVICLNANFFDAFDRGDFPLVNPTIGGTTETYHSISPNHEVVRPYQYLIHRIRSYVDPLSQ